MITPETPDSPEGEPGPPADDLCAGCSKSIAKGDFCYSGQAHRGILWHFDCWSQRSEGVQARPAPLELTGAKRKLRALADLRPEPDERAPDGFLVNGWRRVRKGGVVIFHRARHHHEFLEKMVGQYVYCEIKDWTGGELVVYPGGLGKRDRENGRIYTERVPYGQVGPQCAAN